MKITRANTIMLNLKLPFHQKQYIRQYLNVTEPSLQRQKELVRFLETI